MSTPDVHGLACFVENFEKIKDIVCKLDNNITTTKKLKHIISTDLNSEQQKSAISILPKLYRDHENLFEILKNSLGIKSSQPKIEERKDDKEDGEGDEPIFIRNKSNQNTLVKHNIIDEICCYNEEVTKEFIAKMENDEEILFSVSNNDGEELFVLTSNSNILSYANQKVSIIRYNQNLTHTQKDILKSVLKINHQKDCDTIIKMLNIFHCIGPSSYSAETSVKSSNKDCDEVMFQRAMDIIEIIKNSHSSQFRDKIINEFIFGIANSTGEKIILIRQEPYEPTTTEYIIITNMARILRYSTNNSSVPVFREFNFLLTDINIDIIDALLKIKYTNIGQIIMDVMNIMRNDIVSSFVGIDNDCDESDTFISPTRHTISETGSSSSYNTILKQNYDRKINKLNKSDLNSIKIANDFFKNNVVIFERQNFIQQEQNSFSLDASDYKTEEDIYFSRCGQVIIFTSGSNSNNTTCEIFDSKLKITSELEEIISEFILKNKGKIVRLILERFMKSLLIKN